VTLPDLKTFCYYVVLSIVLLVSCNIYAVGNSVGIIVPLEHVAMTQIVSGIKKALSGEDLEIIVKNAHGDANIMATIIRQINDSDMNIVIPIGTSTSQMAISHIKSKNIICAAANIKPSKDSKVTGVNDEVSMTSALSELPILKHIAVIYSANEKVIPEIKEIESYANSHDIKLYLVMVQSLSELPLAIKNIPEAAQAFLILKDHLIVSGVNILIQDAKKRSIPLIASDEGSVYNGATLAIGVKEEDIGVSAGLMAKDIIHGKDAKSIPYQSLDKLTLFINTKAFLDQKILTRDILSKVPLSQIEIKGD
jgi:putative ABC transport system substrate-binding protein